ncbi:MAG TPA: DUF167 domain-containing protein [Terriglobales bacterium]|nr:DUF167 domain-containing protein [Terriglobales bacterium]
MIPIRESAGAVTFAVKVHPRAKRDAVIGEIGNALKIALNAPPVDGKANEACIRYMAEILRVPRASVTIAAGETSRNKLIRVAGVSASHAEERLREAKLSGDKH